MMSDQQIENAAKAMYEDDVANTPQDGLQPPWNHLAVEWRVMYYRRARAAAPHLTKELADTVDALRKRMEEALEYAKRIEGEEAKALTEVTRLRDALEKYGAHGVSCAVYDTPPSPECSCGLMAALAQARGTE